MFFDFPTEIRTIICTINLIENLNEKIKNTLK
ncbi:transposase [Jejuia pallidilutea]|nr:transposase [Jejuia pallidilutea]